MPSSHRRLIIETNVQLRGPLVLMKIRLLLVIYLTMVVKSCRLCFNNVSLMNY